MRTGYNKNLANDAKVKLLTEQFQNTEKTLAPLYDSKGNVIRDYVTEVKVLSQDEHDTLLPSAELSYFDGFRIMQKHREDNETIKPIVDRIKLAPLPASKKKVNLIEKCVVLINTAIQRISPLSKEQMRQPFYNKKGWIYPYIITNARRRAA